jgi:DNA-binding transcriptional ArsR family regulator
VASLLVLFLTSPPVDLHTVVGQASTIDEALGILEATPVEQLRAELQPLRPRAGDTSPWTAAWLRDLFDGDPGARRELVERLHEYYGSAVDPYWKSIRAFLEAERDRRGRIMADAGVGRLLATLHPSISWQPPLLLVGDVTQEPAACRSEPHVLGGRSVALVPSVFCLDEPRVLARPGDRTSPLVLFYPALRDREDATAIWTPEAESGHRALARLLGETRASALEAIADTCTTSEVARRIGVSLPTASHHAAVLRAKGLIVSRRHGGTMIHRITALGAGLLGSGPVR